VFIDVSEEVTASIFRSKEEAKQQWAESSLYNVGDGAQI
jgi:hypothetical protein